jgi:sugar phosphate permease
MTPAWLILMLSLLLGLQPITTDLYLPALPALTQEFAAPMAQAQLTLSALLLAFGLSQLVWGPLSDRFGRRPILLMGLTVYVLALAAVALRFEETVTQKNRDALQPAQLLNTWIGIGRHPTFLASSSFVFIQVPGLSKTQSVWAIMLPPCLFMLGHGIHPPCSQSGSVGPFSQTAGTASALNGFIMMVAAFVMGGWLGTHMDGTAMPLVLGVCFWSVLIALTAWTRVQKFGVVGEH